MLVVTASYEGQPADNAAHFVNWLENVQDASAFAGIKFGVFGCGNRDWVNTYQRVPKLVDELLGAHGGVRLVERGEGDAAAAEFFEVFDEWEKAVWEKLGKVRTRSCFRRVQVARLMVILTFDLIGVRHDCEQGGDGPADQEGLWGCRARGDSAPEGYCAWDCRREQGVDRAWRTAQAPHR